MVLGALLPVQCSEVETGAASAKSDEKTFLACADLPVESSQLWLCSSSEVRMTGWVGQAVQLRYSHGSAVEPHWMRRSMS